ncbi:C39 family peptidase [Paenibacillus sp. EKM211P]|uniref:C39 family peptidase n=1 Tax=Paenibacillus sp. EKM211P TaxID=1683679 RepID=UPI0013E97C2A|nr:BtrH N-terminal domain-containing protein [Paenibacillus sp. EKM211P]KAF6582674.1 C39 family peptidase [Paenibacillus sp. EKM211P]
MPLNIQPYHAFPHLPKGAFQSCIDDIIATISCYFNRDYHLMYSNMWQFNYTKNADISFAQRFSGDLNGELDLLEKYHGIRIEYHESIKLNELLEISEDEISNGYPVITMFDSYYNSWDPFYNKLHNKHACLITGINKKNKTVYITDPYFEKVNEEVPFQILERASEYYGLIKLLDNNPTIDLEKLLISKSEDFIRDNGMKAFISDISDQWSDDLSFLWDRTNERDFWVSDFYQTFKNQIILKRHKFITIIDFYKKRSPSKLLDDLIDEYTFIINFWEMFINMLTKSAFLVNQKQGLKENIVAKISEAAQLETSLAQKIIENASPRDSLSSKVDLEKKNNKPCDYVQINLQSYLNNKGFSYLLSATVEADLTGAGEYLLMDKPMNNNLFIDEIPLFFPEIAQSKYDNVSCTGQMILFPQNSYKKVILMWCSEWGDSAGYITINYSNGQSNRHGFSLSDMSLQPQFNERIALPVKCVLKESLNTKDAYLFLTKFNLNSENEVSSIQLPNSPNVHVFAMSLEV